MAVPGIWLLARGLVCAADFTTQVAGPLPLGLQGLMPEAETPVFGLTEGIKGDFSYGLGLETVYDSNFFLSENDPESEFTANLSPWITYLSDPEGGAPFSFTANYRPTFRGYMNNPELNDVDQSGGVSLKIVGAKTLVAGYVNYSTVSGTDRLTGTFINGSILQAGMRASYQIAPRTALFANLRFAMSDYASSSLVGSENYSAEIGGFWSATERLSFGPSLRYTRDESDNTGTRDSWALNMQARYLYGEKLQLVASLGADFSSNSREGGGSSMGLTGGLAANYAINERLTWQSSIRYVTVPSPTDVNYVINNLTVSTALSRQLLRATVSLGLDAHFSDYVEVGAVATSLNTQDNFSAVLTYRRKLFTDRLDFDASVRYSVNQGGADWSQLLLSMGLRCEF